MTSIQQGDNVEGAIAWAAADGKLPADMQALVVKALDFKDRPFEDAIKEFGPSCGMPGAFQVR